MSIAWDIAEEYNNDGQCFQAHFMGMTINDRCHDEARSVSRGEGRDYDKIKYEFDDRSYIIITDAAWEVGHSSYCPAG